ncbi:hypothetical protein [Coxiella burnetii]|nr:hypothetical protein [Coxiella burnetii]PNT89888.1 hypothetical protein C2L89_01650 [Coxiella burnetii]
MIRLSSNRHFTLENYTYHLVKYLLATKQKDNKILQSLADTRQDSHYPAYTDEYPRTIIAKESHAMADRVDKEIRKIFPKKYVADPNYVFF